MVLKDKENKLKGRKCEILATDISNQALEKAREAKYTQFEVQRGMSVKYLMTYFTQDGDKWRLKDEIRNMVKFQHFNLLGDMSRLGKFDVIFCRNVLIYFDDSTKKKVLENIAQRMAADGFLFLGGAETVLGLTDKFKPVSDKRGIYVHNSTQAPNAEGAKQVLERNDKS
jgi:chemotaxis protein methyltransferase CheR